MSVFKINLLRWILFRALVLVKRSEKKRVLNTAKAFV